MNPKSFECIQDLAPRSGGLTSAEINLQRSRYGSNNILEEKTHPLIALVQETLRDPMIWLLVGISLLFLLAGQKTDGLVLALAILPLLLMDAFLHWRTESSTAFLHAKLLSQVWVLRDEKRIEIDSRALVPGDLVYVSAQQLLPADGVFEKAEDVQIDESALTGESFPVSKKPMQLSPFQVSSTISNQLSREVFGFAGTRVLKGRAHLRILSTGGKTLYGEIVQSVVRMPQERTPLQRSITRIVQTLIYSALIFCVLLSFIRRLQGHDWLDAILSAATLALAAIPEEFPVVFSFFLGVGVYRLAKRKAFVRRAVSIENLGRVRQICTDKTGTLTEGKLHLTHLRSSSEISQKDLLESARAACSSNEDPLDLAILESASIVLRQTSEVKKIHHFPFTEDRKRETAITESPEGSFFSHSKGAPEKIFSLSDLSLEEIKLWKIRVSEWALLGCKVIAVARKRMTLDKENFQISEPVSGMEFMGLMAFEDPPRPE
ncbi:MAG: HAD-IC family P-type ATPase, partial [Bdellovibrio sp.]